MISVDMKALLGRLNPFCTRCLEGAAGLCVSRTHYEVTIEHFIAKALEDAASDISIIIRQFGLNSGMVKKALDRTLEEFKSGNAGKPVFSPMLMQWFQDAWLIGSVDLGETRIRTGALLLTVLSKPAIYGSGSYVDLLTSIPKDGLESQFYKILGNSVETISAPSEPGAPGEPEKGPMAPGSALAKFCEDYTQKARDGKIDPVFGRDNEIRQIIDILGRRRKNNPICVGEAGVGKTAVVEGLALRIVQGDVPDAIKDVSIIGLDMGLLQAGAGVKGEFENRLKSVITEVKSSPKPIILFIDEAHTLIGAGGPSGGSDAANLLKPALARGELKTVAATTFSEYKKYIEKDPALARRFQMVKLDEPNVKNAILILRGVKASYEKAHKVVIRDDAVVAAVELSSRYIQGRQLPDKCIDLTDTCCARVKVSMSSKPAILEDRERSIQALEREKSAKLRDQDHGVQIDEERIAEIDKSLAQLSDEVAALKVRWQKEKETVGRIIEVRHKLHDLKMAKDASRNAEAEPEGEPSDAKALTDAAQPADTAQPADAQAAAPAAPETLEGLEKELNDVSEQLKEIQGDSPMIKYEVDPDVVAQVVSDWTGIPLGKVLRDQAQSVLHLDDELKTRIKGQDQALHVVAEVIKSSKSGISDPKQPIGVFLFVGPSGVGKTETGLTVADLMFGGEQYMVTINMSEFQEKHTVSRLIGSPPGYVGYGEGGMLTEAVRQRPYCVVLLDEIEKAHPDVLNLFYQVFDKGVLSDGEGREVDFKDTIIFLTSNLATDVITEMTKAGQDRPDLETLSTAIRPILSNYLKPALLARMNLVPFYTLDEGAMKGIVVLKLQKLARQLMNNNKMKFTWSDQVVDTIAARCTEVETGARNIDFIMRGTILPQMSQQILSHMTTGGMPGSVHLDMNEDSTFKMTFADV